MKKRNIVLSDSNGMDGELVILRTNAPINRLKSLEKESQKLYANGEDVPIWADILEAEGYMCDIVDSCRHVTPYCRSDDWQKEYYPEVTEFYNIEA